MKRFGNPLLSIAAPLLISLSLFAYFQRDGKDKAQVLPSMFVGFGIIVSGLVRRQKRRRKLLEEILELKNKKI